MKKKVQLAGLILLALLLARIIYVHYNFPQPVTIAAPIVYHPPQELLALANKIGIGYQGLAATHAQIGNPASGNCALPIADACYSPSTKTLYLFVNAFTNSYNDPATTLAYEYAHYDWQLLGPVAQHYVPALHAWYLAHQTEVNAEQGGIFQEGRFGSAIIDDELHSLACTEAQDNELAPNLLAECNSFLPHREVLNKLL